MQIERGFQNNYGENFANIVNVGFSSLSELRDFLGKFITETKKENNNFATAKGDYDGIFLYQMPSINDEDYAYRIYRDFEKYKYRRHYDDKLISFLQSKQHLIKNVDFPLGVVTIENEVIGQIIYLYKNSQTIFSYLNSIKGINIFEKEYYDLLLKVLNILKSLYENDIFYIDIHPNNFLIVDGSIKIIDFENHSIDNSKDKEKYFIHNLCYIIKFINNYFNMECDIDKNDSFEEVYHKVRKRKENYERKIN